jgi:hypothetical protein
MDEILFTAEEGMDKALDFMKHEFSSVRTGKASPALVEGIEVAAYGSVMKLKQLALISTTTTHRHPTFRRLDDKIGRESDQRIEDRHHSLGRRQDHSPSRPRTQRGTAQGPGQNAQEYG